MKSYQAFSDEIDNLELAVEQIAKQVENFNLSPNTGGVLYCGSEVNTSALCKILWERLKFPFIGTTCLGQFTNDGYHEASICLNLFTGEDISFSGGMTGELTSENMIEEIKEAYANLKNKMKRPEVSMLLYIPWYPGVVYDEILDALTEASGGIPIFGGICSDEWTFDNCYALCHHGAFKNRAAILMVGGDFNPQFVTSFSINWTSENSVNITKASGTTVYEIEGQPASEYFNSIGLHFLHENVFSDCLSSPMILKYTDSEGKEQTVIRNLFTVNNEDGSVTFAGRVLEGSKMNLALTSRIAINQTIDKPVDEILDVTETEYEPSGVLVSSCTGRYCLTVADKNIECSALHRAVERGLIVGGGYLNGEFCPIKDESTGKYTTVLNNETFTLMKF